MNPRVPVVTFLILYHLGLTCWGVGVLTIVATCFNIMFRIAMKEFNRPLQSKLDFAKIVGKIEVST
jgi:hypothetical protein